MNTARKLKAKRLRTIRKEKIDACKHWDRVRYELGMEKERTRQLSAKLAQANDDLRRLLAVRVDRLNNHFGDDIRLAVHIRVSDDATRKCRNVDRDIGDILTRFINEAMHKIRERRKVLEVLVPELAIEPLWAKY